MRLILIRHGLTDWSGDRYMGREDVALSPDGVAQAEALADQLQGEPVQRIWSSPLRRALATAHPLSVRTAVPITVVDDLAEMDYGDLQGVAKTERRLRVRADHVTTPIPGGESLAQVASRAQRVCDRLAAGIAADETVAVVAHYRLLQFALGCLTGTPFEEMVADPGYRPANASAYALTWRPAADGGPRVVDDARWLAEGDGA
jgi:2,3-bisphosphoglycerate-dependent phosphoglycerate mutase